MSDIEKRFKAKGTVTKLFTIPLLVWEEWQQDCMINFNNTYHLKMLFDHEFRKQFQSTVNLVMQDMVEMREQIFELKAEIDELKNNELKEKRKTF